MNDNREEKHNDNVSPYMVFGTQVSLDTNALRLTNMAYI